MDHMRSEIVHHYRSQHEEFLKVIDDELKKILTPEYVEAIIRQEAGAVVGEIVRNQLKAAASAAFEKVATSGVVRELVKKEVAELLKGR
jgi:translation initiation factor RLI1